MRRRTTPPARYGYAHQQRRKAAAKHLAANGGAICWRCGKIVLPTDLWDLGHDDVDRDVYRGVEHRKCNRSTVVHRGHPQPDEPQPRALSFFN